MIIQRNYKLRKLFQLKSKQEINKRKPSAQVNYEKEVSKAYIEHNKKANENGYKKAIGSVKAGNTKTWQKVYEKAYIETPISKKLKDTLAEQTESYYKYKRSKGLKKATYELNITDRDTVDILSKSDLLWIKNHAKRTNVSTEMSRIISKGAEDGLSGDEIAIKLSEHFKGLAPESYTAIFGEQAYWEMVTNTNVTRVSSFSDLNTFDEIGITQYKIDTRGALACPICAPYEGRIYDVAPAMNKKDLYMDYADKGDVDSMKEVYTFGEANVDGLGETPPFHPNCYCLLQAIIEEA